MLEAHQKNPKKEVGQSLLKSENNLENQANAPKPFPCFDKDTGQELTSPVESEKLEFASGLLKRDAREV